MASDDDVMCFPGGFLRFCFFLFWFFGCFVEIFFWMTWHLVRWSGWVEFCEMLLLGFFLWIFLGFFFGV